MKFKGFAAVLAFIISLSLQTLSVRAEDFYNALQQAINANNWKQAIEIIDKMIEVYSSSPDYVRELKAYKAKIQVLQPSKSKSNHSHNTTNTIKNNNSLIKNCQQQLNFISSAPPLADVFYYQGRAELGIFTGTENLVAIYKLMRKASAEFQLQNYQEALSLYAQVIQISPHDPSAWEGIGYIMIKARNYQAALKSFDQATKSYDFPTEDTKFRGLAYCVLGNYQQARIDLEAYFQDNGGNDFSVRDVIMELRKRT